MVEGFFVNPVRVYGQEVAVMIGFGMFDISGYLVTGAWSLSTVDRSKHARGVATVCPRGTRVAIEPNFDLDRSVRERSP